MKLERSGREITVVAEKPSGAEKLELRIKSSRNANIPKGSDPSPRNPDKEAMWYSRHHRNVLYPVVDVELTEEMEGVLQLSHLLLGKGSINPQYYSQEKQLLAEEMVFPASKLELWENWFCYNDCNLEPEGFYLRLLVGEAGREIKRSFTLLSDFWQGSVELWDIAGEEPRLLDMAELNAHPELRPTNPRRDLSRESMVFALEGCMEYLLKSRQSKPGSPMPKGAHLFYDYDARTFRQKNWLWTFGPGIRALIQAGDVPEITRAFGKDRLVQLARDLGETAVQYQMTESSHPAYGLLMCRYDFEAESEKLYESKYSPADGLFLAGWGWMPLYKATGDKKYLDACRLMVRGTGKILEIDEIVQQDFYGVEGIWKNWTMDESGFGMEGLADTYLETGDAGEREIAVAYLGQLLKHLERPDGLWERNYHRHSKRVQPFSGATRGMGWAMEAVTSAWRMGLGDTYLHKSKMMADFMLEHQQADGCWSFICTEPKDKQGISEKGTPLWSVLLYRLYDMCGEDKYRDAARRALGWCVKNQYFGVDQDGRGGLVACSPASGVTYRKYFQMSCHYAVGFFALALQEELRRT